MGRMNRYKSWVEQGQIMGRTGSNHLLNGVNHESNRVESFVERSQSLVEQGRIISRTVKS